MRPTLDDDTISDSAALMCPSCGCSNLHHYRVEVYARRLEDSATGMRAEISTRGSVTVNTSMAGNPSARRDGVRIHLHCEQCPALVELTIVQHKGTTYLETNVVGKRGPFEEYDYE